MSNEYREVRAFYRHMNFNSSSAHRRKCKKTAEHTLRLSHYIEANNQLNWNPKLFSENLIWYRGNTHKLHEMSEQSKSEIIAEIVPPPPIKDKKKIQAALSKARHKLNQYVVALEDDYSSAARLFEIILDDTSPLTYHDQVYFKELLEREEMPRAKQRIAQFVKFCENHRALQDSAPLNSTYVQEGIFKIPSRWNVGVDIISKQAYIDFIHQFLTEMFPDHAIKAIVLHDDEREVNENTGAHIHYFLSGRNKKTCEFDLRKAEIAVVNRYIDAGVIDNAHFPTDGSCSYQQSKELGHCFQVLVQHYANQHLLHPHDLTAKFTPETEKRTEEYRHKIRQGKLPKHEREYNFHQRHIEQQQLIVDAMLRQQETLEIECQQKAQNKEELSHLITNLKLRAKQYSTDIEQRQQQHAVSLLKQEMLIQATSQQLASIQSTLENETKLLEHTRKQQKMLNLSNAKILGQLMYEAFLIARNKHSTPMYRELSNKFFNRIIDKMARLMNIELLSPVLASIKSVLHEEGVNIDRNNDNEPQP